ncbi:hypothetical protein L1887_17957 [Cichorium endivia]|nr:hypothetical protein L1887_17957 [Cichorium endivia]
MFQLDTGFGFADLRVERVVVEFLVHNMCLPSGHSDHKSYKGDTGWWSYGDSYSGHRGGKDTILHIVLVELTCYFNGRFQGRWPAAGHRITDLAWAASLRLLRAAYRGRNAIYEKHTYVLVWELSPLVPGKQIGPSVDWDVYECLPSQDFRAIDTSPVQLLRVHYYDPTQLEWMTLNFL